MNTENSHFYRIRVAGTLESDWTSWFDGMALTVADDSPDETILSGEVRDQAELYGLLNRLRDLNLKLISVEQSRPHGSNNGTDSKGGNE